MSDPIHLAIHGAAGRMGQKILTILAGEPSPRWRITGLIDHPEHPQQGQRFAPELPPLTATLPAQVPIDVIVDFSHPAALCATLPELVARRIALVSGTTGFDDGQRALLHDAAQHIPLLLAANMSMGINLLMELVRMASAALGPTWDAEIVEVHHRLKRDAPSGTALLLAQALADGRAPDAAPLCLGRAGAEALRHNDEIGLHALRGGDVVGEHTVYFFGHSERVEISHRATDRAIFAHGALRSAQWIHRRAPGRYTMQDVIRDA